MFYLLFVTLFIAKIAIISAIKIPVFFVRFYFSKDNCQNYYNSQKSYYKINHNKINPLSQKAKSAQNEYLHSYKMQNFATQIGNLF